MSEHVQNWVSTLSRDDLMSFSLPFHQVLVNKHGELMTPASESIGKTLNMPGRTIRELRASFLANGGCFPDTLQGKYQRQEILWNSEELNQKVRKYIRRNALMKGQLNLTASKFCQWFNCNLIPSESLAPGFPHSISVQTARIWMHELGFCH